MNIDKKEIVLSSKKVKRVRKKDLINDKHLIQSSIDLISTKLLTEVLTEKQYKAAFILLKRIVNSLPNYKIK